LVCKFNDLGSVEEAFKANPSQIAVVIVEPVVGNCGCIPPADGFLQGLRDICTREGALLIFDEVMTGFRVAPGGAAELYGVKPDLVTLGKVIGGGLPVGAYGGKRELMEQVAPAGMIYQAGTLSGNPLAMAAGLATLQRLNQSGTYEELERKSARLADGLRNTLGKLGLKYTPTRVGSMFSLFFTDEPVLDDTISQKCDLGRFNRYFWGMLERGIYLAPSQFEAVFVSTAHTDEDIDRTIKAAQEALRGTV
jgi:glutamate-1-semialdehyde 2,1-aminomutase